MIDRQEIQRRDQSFFYNDQHSSRSQSYKREKTRRPNFKLERITGFDGVDETPTPTSLLKILVDYLTRG